jgi:acylphosphatase
MKVRAHIVIKGRVQGVFFRSEINRRAVDFEVNGWVKNTPNGDVEAIFEGQEILVNKLIEFCRKGPSRARVTSIDLNWEEPTGEFKDFRVVY